MFFDESFFDANKILFVILFIIIVCVVIYVYRSLNTLRFEISKINTGTTNNDTLMNTIVKNEENINKTNLKLESFIKYFVGNNIQQQQQEKQKEKQEPSKNKEVFENEVEDEDEDEDEVIED